MDTLRSRKTLALTLAFCSAVAAALVLPSSEAGASDAKRNARIAIKAHTQKIDAGLRHYVAYEAISDTRCEIVLKKSTLSTNKSYTIDVWSTKTARPSGYKVKVMCLDSECITQHQSVTYPRLSYRSFDTDSAAVAEEIAPLFDAIRKECWNYRKG